MDYTKLLAPYSEDGRTIEGQIRWLADKYQIPRNFIDQALMSVYDEVERGKKFTNGHDLDRYLLSVAHGLWKGEAVDSIRKLEAFHGELRNQWSEDLKSLALKMGTAEKQVVEVPESLMGHFWRSFKGIFGIKK